MLTRETAIETVKNFTQELLALGIPLQRVVLFGSYARGEQREDSDIDVALFSDVFSGYGFADKKLFAKVNVKKQYIDIEAKTFTFINNEDPFVEIIERTGLEVFHAAKEGMYG
jgi:predicted nucleotidyltransferase